MKCECCGTRRKVWYWGDLDHRQFCMKCADHMLGELGKTTGSQLSESR